MLILTVCSDNTANANIFAAAPSTASMEPTSGRQPTYDKTTFASPKLGASVLPNRHALAAGPGVSIYCEKQGPHSWEEHHHEAAQILIPLESAHCEFLWREPCGTKRSRTIGNGDLLMLAPRIRHAKQWFNKASIIILYLSDNWLSQFGPHRIEGVAVKSIRELTLRDPLIGALTNEIRQSCIPLLDERRGHAAALGYCLAARVMHGMRQCSSSERAVVRKLSAETMQRIALHVHARIAERIPMATLAKEARLSPSHFGVLFKATTGMTCEQYVMRVRLARAKELIESGAYTVGQVAHMTGFSDHSHLSLRFVEHFGSPPKSYLPSVRTV